MVPNQDKQVQSISTSAMLCFAGLLLVSLHQLTAAPSQFEAAKQVSTLKSPVIDEASGMAASREHEGVVYLINDHTTKTEENKLYAVQISTGNLMATITIVGATNWDWEDIAVGPCPDGDSCIYIGDIGGSGGTPKNTIYRLKEPAEMKDQSVPFIDKLTYSWNEPESECLMVDPTGNVYIVSRIRGGHGLMAKLPSFGWGGKIVTPTLTSRLSTNTAHHDPLGCDISPDGKAILIKAKDDIYYYSVSDGDYVAAVTKPATKVSYNHQGTWGESIAWSVKGDGYYTVSEGLYNPIYFYAGATSPNVVG